MKYGNMLKERRKNSGYTQKEIAQSIQVTQQAISYYENDINEPTITICVLLADFYGITVDDLIGHEVKKNW